MFCIIDENRNSEFYEMLLCYNYQVRRMEVDFFFGFAFCIPKSACHSNNYFLASISHSIFLAKFSRFVFSVKIMFLCPNNSRAMVMRSTFRKTRRDYNKKLAVTCKKLNTLKCGKLDIYF
jgi:hypothetical protein